MKIEEAIKVLKSHMNPSWEVWDIEPVDFDSAILLGIEALKSVKAFREDDRPLPLWWLPGEY